jgi:hypothetical protein
MILSSICEGNNIPQCRGKNGRGLRKRKGNRIFVIPPASTLKKRQTKVDQEAQGDLSS